MGFCAVFSSGPGLGIVTWIVTQRLKSSVKFYGVTWGDAEQRNCGQVPLLDST